MVSQGAWKSVYASRDVLYYQMYSLQMT